MKRKIGVSVHKWLDKDKIMWRILQGESTDQIVTDYQIKAANDGFNKRQQRAIRLGVYVIDAYVKVTSEKNKDLEPHEIFALIMSWSAETPAEGIQRIVEAIGEI